MAEKMLKDLPQITEATDEHKLLAWSGNNAAGGISIPTLAAKLGGITEQSLQNNGYVKFASGLIIQWGSKTVNGSTRSIEYNITFPNQCCSLILTGKWGLMSYHNDSTLTTGFTFDVFATYGGLSTTASTEQATLNWFAIGY